AETWEWTGRDLKITTDPLDVDSILREVAPTATYPGAPDGLRIGHVHLRVGDVARAEAFYRDALGLDVTRRRQGATFMSSGRYHPPTARRRAGTGRGRRGAGGARGACRACARGPPAPPPARGERRPGRRRGGSPRSRPRASPPPIPGGCGCASRARNPFIP